MFAIHTRPRSFSLVIALIPLGDIPKYLVTICKSVVAVLHSALNQFGYAFSSCQYGCPTVLTDAIRTVSDQLVTSAQLLVEDIPILSALLYIILASAIYAILNAVRLRRPDGSLAPNFDAPGVSSITFIGIVLFSMYLSLSALLAVPLMQRQLPPDGYSQADFEARLRDAIPEQQRYVQAFPELTIGVPTTEQNDVQRRLAARLPAWNAFREAAYQALQSKRHVAIETFRSQSALGLGGREVVSHDAALYLWFIDQRDAVNRQVRECFAAAREVIAAAAQGESSLDPSRYAYDGGSPDRACNATEFGTDKQVPGRANRVEGLTSFIRECTRWLIGPESMPLIIIAGLVGFSFLGAGLSRVIRLGVGRQLETLSLSDLILVTLSGASAALLIFLASYGGLVVLGESDADPSPYVVFALCFVAAIFSEDVWAWARTNILGRLGTVKTGAPPDSDPPKTPAGG